MQIKAPEGKVGNRVETMEAIVLQLSQLILDIKTILVKHAITILEVHEHLFTASRWLNTKVCPNF
jgi:hypothetical protein